jgi:hypothetical protein
MQNSKAKNCDRNLNPPKKTLIERKSRFEIKILILKVTKSIDFTMLVVRVGLSINLKLILTTLKTMIMKKIEKISLIEIKERIMNFIKSMVLGVAFVGKDGLTSDYKV